LGALAPAALLLALAMLLAVGGPAPAAKRFITLASTTSTANSGLFDHILPLFTAATAIEVRVVAVGTGAALKLGERGDADVVLVHARAAEEAFVARGFGALRRDLMYNDFVIVGPASDPAGIAGSAEAPAALTAIARAAAPFVSRGDDSGTHKAELRLWRAAGIDPNEGSGKWYFETGSGMGATLNTAAAKGAYGLSDRGTWLAFRNRGDLVVVVEGDRRLFNPYGVMLVNPERHPHVKRAAAMALIDWLTSAPGQAAIASFKIGGEPLFVPNYGRHRAGFPEVFFERLSGFGIGLEGQRVLDLGTGAGTLARGFARRGCRVTGLDVSSELEEEAKRLDAEAGVTIEYLVAAAEDTGLSGDSFDVVSAGQCWHWFERPKTAREARRLLVSGGRLVIAHFDWLPLKGSVVKATERLIETYNPEWAWGGGVGIHPKWLRDVANAGFEDIESFSFDTPVAYSHEAWRGRVRASAGVGASLPNDWVENFDREHARMLSERFPEEPLMAPHRVFAVISRSP
jgi:tungstate transport system substrate-binding protein